MSLGSRLHALVNTSYYRVCFYPLNVDSSDLWWNACGHLSHFSRVQLLATLWAIAHQAPLCTGFSRQEYWRELPCPLPEIFPTQGSNPHLLRWEAGSFPLAPPGKPLLEHTNTEVRSLLLKVMSTSIAAASLLDSSSETVRESEVKRGAITN